ncbi:hypothetical protein KAW18_03830 [candidate division WOR-3 bacterium]|nr:hypothetical protein [candidate division WOR-3 bacterium]
MFKWLFNYQKKLKKEDYNNGFNWAAGALLRKEKTPTQLTNYSYGSKLDSFDHGIIGAINKLKEIGFIKKDYLD